MARRKRPVPVDEIANAEAVVRFYEERLDQALERLGELLDKREKRLAALRGVGRAAS